MRPAAIGVHARQAGRARVTVLGAAALLAVVVAVFLAVAPAQRARLLRLFDPPVIAPYLTSHHRDSLQYHLRGDAVLPDGQWLLFGDSLSEGLPEAALLLPVTNYGIGHDDLEGMANRLPSYDSVGRAGGVLIALSSNGLARGRALEAIERDLERLLNGLPRGVPVVCLAALPIDERVMRDWRGRDNARIRALNERLGTRCRERGHGWVDVAPALLDPGGNLAARLHVGDGLHLGPDGYVVWTAHLNDRLATR